MIARQVGLNRRRSAIATTVVAAIAIAIAIGGRAAHDVIIIYGCPRFDAMLAYVLLLPQ